MNNTLKLRRPILINGVEVSELTYNAEEITNDLFLTACMKSSIKGNDMNGSVVRELNTALHLQLGKAAIIAVNPSYDWGDLDRIKGFDLNNLCNIGLVFIRGASEEPSEENSSEKQSANTPESTTQVPQNSVAKG